MPIYLTINRYYAYRDICPGCYRRRSLKQICQGCQRHTRLVNFDLQLCFNCSRLATRPVGPCSRCAQLLPLYDEAAQLCRGCAKYLRKLARNKAKQVKKPCRVCGKPRSACIQNDTICAHCWKLERNGQGVCQGCNEFKIIFNKKATLCGNCHSLQSATRRLKKFLTSFATPYPYNHQLFEFFTAELDWQKLDHEEARLYLELGGFLQTQVLTEPVSWEQLEQLTQPQLHFSRSKNLRIRSALLALGHFLAAKGQLESRENYLARHRSLMPLEHAPHSVRPLLQRYAQWLVERQNTPNNIYQHLKILVAFWSWSEKRGLTSPAQLQVTHLSDYRLNLYWQWECKACMDHQEFDPTNRKVPKNCQGCGAVHTLHKVRRYAQNTVRNHHAKLLVFFDWARLNRLVISNPASGAGTVKAPEAKLSHYPLQVLQKLAEYLTSPKTDPLEAMLLYLIIFHAFSVWEMRHIQLPVVTRLEGHDTPVEGESGKVSSCNLAEAYYVILPSKKPSLGRHRPGRLGGSRIDFPMAAQDWLKPLLERFQTQRNQVVKNESNPYVIISVASAPHCTPVSMDTINRYVGEASLKAIGARCKPKLLRQTAGTLYADRSGGAVLRWMGWSEQRAFAYNWLTRELVQPQPVPPTETEVGVEKVPSPALISAPFPAKS